MPGYPVVAVDPVAVNLAYLHKSLGRFAFLFNLLT